MKDFGTSKRKKKLVPQECPLQMWPNLEHVISLEDDECVCRECGYTQQGCYQYKWKRFPAIGNRPPETFFEFVFKQKGATVALTEFWAHPNAM